MSKWLVRGLVFAGLMVVVRLIQGALINQYETQALLISLTLLAVLVVVVLVWGYLDGRSDARTNPDPDRREDLAMTWLLAGLVAGLVSGAVSWLISLFYSALYVGGLINELTTFAAFTALLVFVPAVAAAAIGRWLVDRKAPPVDRKAQAEGGAAYDDDRADTDVFAAVREDDFPTGPTPVVSDPSNPAHDTESHGSAVATAERDTGSSLESSPEPSRESAEEETQQITPETGGGTDTSPGDQRKD
ncbi:B-4DMT family transporter [Mycolicibacterium palauense]|uniref:B-4DMT family transporter n=1 Tax=Mycolicibacterium palauense TaxID=2034511 RepID=UPI00159BED14|nr:B-4DMT family transporter [Mycolicibacterium palauense]